MKVDFESVVTWKQTTDYLRCNPSFHGRSRHDGVIVNEDNASVSFGLLRFVFVCDIAHLAPTSRIPLVLIQSLDAPIGARKAKDKDLGLFRLRSPQHSIYRIIPARSIIRGAYLVEDPVTRGDFFAVDTVDTDMFLRLKSIFQPDMW